jgi:hypothetical protein
VISLELTVGSKILPIAFFVADVQGRYTACVLLGRKWIRANQCDNSAGIALTESVVNWQIPCATCLG